MASALFRSRIRQNAGEAAAHFTRILANAATICVDVLLLAFYSNLARSALKFDSIETGIESCTQFLKMAPGNIAFRKATW